MDRKCSNAYSKYRLSGLSLYLKYINKAICTISIQYVLSRTSGKCKNTVTIQCKYSRSTQLQVAAAATTELPFLRPGPRSRCPGSGGSSSWQAPAGGSAEPGVRRDQGEGLHSTHKGKSRGRRSPRGWPASRAQGAGRPPARGQDIGRPRGVCSLRLGVETTSRCRAVRVPPTPRRLTIQPPRLSLF